MNFTGLSPHNPSRYTGPQVALATVVTRNRAPTGADYRQPETGKLYPFDTYWIVGKDPTTGTEGDLWYLSKIVANVGYWMQLSTGSSGPLLSVVVPLGVSPIVPDGTGQLTFTSSLGSINITGSSASPNNNTINFDLVGGGGAVDSFQVDQVTAPGVNPVTPTVAGLVTVGASAVANHSVPIETRSRALNTYKVEAQYATSAAATDATKSGMAHFDSAKFTVDANGFVQLTPTIVPFTPALTFGGASTGLTYVGREGNAITIGKLVVYEFKIILSNKGSSTGVAAITGFPSASLVDCTSCCLTQNCAFPGAASAFIGVLEASTQKFVPYGQSSTAIIQLQDTEFTNSSVIQSSGIYMLP